MKKFILLFLLSSLYISSNAQHLPDVRLRTVTHAPYSTKGSTLTWTELDNNFVTIGDLLKPGLNRIAYGNGSTGEITGDANFIRIPGLGTHIFTGTGDVGSDWLSSNTLMQWGVTDGTTILGLSGSVDNGYTHYYQGTVNAAAIKLDNSDLTITNYGIPFKWPHADGASGQFLKTNGSGTLSWATPSGGGGNPSSTQLLGSLIGADFNTTADQLITLSGGTKFIIVDVVIINASTNLNGCLDGAIYENPMQSGTVIMRTGFLIEMLQYLSSSSFFINNYQAQRQRNSVQGLVEQGSSLVGPTMYFSLGTPLGTPATADIYIYGLIVN